MQFTEELINTFLEQVKFDFVHKSLLFPAEIGSNVVANDVDAVRILYAGARVGQKSIAFLNEIPRIERFTLIKGSFLLVSYKLPDRIDLPIIFIKSVDDLLDRFKIAHRLSMEAQIPVEVLVSPSVFNNISKQVTLEHEHTVVKPYFEDRFIEKTSYETLIETYQFCDLLLKNELKMGNKESKNFRFLSFKAQEGIFFDYLIPVIGGYSFSELFKRGKIKIDKDDDYFFESLQYHLGVKSNFEKIAVSNKVQLRRFLCPGCPFVILNKLFSDKLLFSDIDCEKIYDYFGFKKLSFSEYYGLTRKKLQRETLFVGNLSNSNPLLIDFLEKHQKVVLLKDTEYVKDNMHLPVVRNFKKVRDESFIFPYGCENIPKNKSVTIKTKKCICLEKGGEADCYAKTFCPALFENSKKIYINGDLCVGCQFCKFVCPYGAIK